ncbi:hypothetical protein AB0B50_38500 [Streptomyces sp. NPDC041068]|uniref:hypothetical protein n=1 Tax=Streptomyces sp. NPDC041068 TaxID=3155130 RepID=UPI0033ED705F
MTRESLQNRQQRARPSGRTPRSNDDLTQMLKQAGIADQRRIAIREEVTRLRAGGNPMPRPLRAPAPTTWWGEQAARLRERIPRWTMESVFWAGGITATAMVWATRGIAVGLAIPLTAVAITARYRYLGGKPSTSPSLRPARGSSREHLASR